MKIKGFPALCSNEVSGVWFFANKALFNAYEILFLKSFDVAGKVPVSNVKILLKRIEI